MSLYGVSFLSSSSTFEVFVLGIAEQIHVLSGTGGCWKSVDSVIFLLALFAVSDTAAILSGDFDYFLLILTHISV